MASPPVGQEISTGHQVYFCKNFGEVHDLIEDIQDEASLAFNIGGVDVYRHQLEEVLGGSYRGAPFKIYWTKIHGKFCCDKFYPVKTLEKVLASNFARVDS